MSNKNYKICHECGERMRLSTVDRAFSLHGKEILIKGIEVYHCDSCGEDIYSDNEVRMIENLMYIYDEKPNTSVDVLNLEETAQYLRVSNQTVYNMIKSGRINAYKIGREWRFLRGDIIAYMNSMSNNNGIALAAKGGKAEREDLEIIASEIQKRKQENE